VNAFDPFYTGAFPSVGAFIGGLALICIVGWISRRKEKK
jgi:LPXTG-motif cell wall-anchored protein